MELALPMDLAQMKSLLKLKKLLKLCSIKELIPLLFKMLMKLLKLNGENSLLPSFLLTWLLQQTLLSTLNWNTKKQWMP